MQPTLDPNWLYSSLVQAAASLIGLLGGIVATRIQTDRSRTAERRQHAIGALRRLDSRLRSQLQVLGAYAEHAPRQVSFLKAELAVGKGMFQAAEWYNPTGVGRGISGGLSGGTIDMEEGRLVAATEGLPVIRELLEVPSQEALRSFVRRLNPIAAQNGYDVAVGFKELVALAEGAAGELAILRSMSEARTYVGLWWCMVLLAATGVAAPAAYLSSYAGPSRYIFLIGFCGGIAAILGYLRYEIAGLRRLGDVRPLLPPPEST